MSHLFFLFIYRAVIAPIAFFLLFFIGIPWNKKIREGFKMRWTKNGINPCLNAPAGARPIWVHCSSGEFEYAKPLVRQFKTLYPHVPILVTYFSPTYRRQIESDPLVDYAVPLPWDLPGPCHSFICHHDPRGLFIARTDLWPELLTQCRRKDIPCYLFSASLPQLKQWKKILGFYHRWVGGKLSCVGVVNQVDFKNFKSLGVTENSLKISGDTRYDQVLYRLENSKIQLTRPKELVDTTMVAGSTWPVEEPELIDGLCEFVKNGKMNLIIAPHEPTSSHLLRLEETILDCGLSSCRISHLSGWERGNVIVVDRVGILAELYRWADMAFIGGSLGRKVHSVMEPLAAGCICFVGPNHTNNSEAVELKESYLSGSQLRFVNVFRSSCELRKLMYNFMAEGLRGPQSEIIDFVRSRAGASREISRWPINGLF